jgi:hypothetical protein
MIWRMWLVEKVGGEYCLGEGEYVFSVNNQRYRRMWKVRGEEALCCQFKAKIDQKLVFSWFLPDMLTGWSILPKSSLMDQ